MMIIRQRVFELYADTRAQEARANVAHVVHVNESAPLQRMDTLTDASFIRFDR